MKISEVKTAEVRVKIDDKRGYLYHYVCIYTCLGEGSEHGAVVDFVESFFEVKARSPDFFSPFLCFLCHHT